MVKSVTGGLGQLPGTMGLKCLMNTPGCLKARCTCQQPQPERPGRPAQAWRTCQRPQPDHPGRPAQAERTCQRPQPERPGRPAQVWRTCQWLSWTALEDLLLLPLTLSRHPARKLQIRYSCQ